MNYERHQRLTGELQSAIRNHEQSVRTAAVAWQKVATAEDFDEAFAVAEALSEQEASARRQVWRVWDDLDAMGVKWPSRWDQFVRRCQWNAAREWAKVKHDVRTTWRPGIMLAALIIVGLTWWTGSVTEGLISVGLIAASMVFTTTVGALAVILFGRYR